MNHEQAVSRAVRLMRLAQSDNANEAASAAAKAQEVIDRYKLGSLGLDADTADPSEAMPDEPVADFGAAPLETPAAKLAEWKFRLASTLAKANQCRIYIHSRVYGFGSDGRRQKSTKQLNIVGRASDAETVRYLYSALVQDVDRLAERDGKGLGVTWRNNFRLGVVDTIGRRLREQRAATEAAMAAEVAARGGAIVLVNNAVAKLALRGEVVADWMKENLDLHAVPVGGGTYDHSGREAGRKAGHELHLGGKARGGLGAGVRKLGGGS